MNRLFDLADKVVVLTGAGGVLAGALVDYLLEQRVRLVALVRRPATLERLQNRYPELELELADVLDGEALSRSCDRLLDRYGRLDGLINAAGGNQPGAVIRPDQTIFDVDLAAYDSVLKLNLQGTLLPTKIFVKAMLAAGKGSIVNFSSMAASQPLSQVLGYGNAKAAVDNLTRALAVELAAKFGSAIRVNAIAPGFFIGNQNRTLLLNDDGSYTDRGRRVIAKTPLGRFGEAGEICGCVHYLLSDAASFVTGAILPVDGGFSASAGV